MYKIPKIEVGEVKRYAEHRGISSMEAYKELVDIRKQSLRVIMISDLSEASTVKDIKPILQAMLRDFV